MKKNKFAIFCTAAEKEQEKYIGRVLHWYDMVYPMFRMDTDFFCFVDGTLNSTPSLNNLHFISFSPSLGRKTMQIFPGLKRSFGEALKYLEDYEFLMFIENDTKLLNFNRILQYRDKPGLYSSIDKKWNFTETRFMILNDKESRRKLMSYYLSDEGMNETCLFEETMSKYPFKYVFQSKRSDGDFIDLTKENLDYICQCLNNYQGHSKRILFTDQHALGDAAENLMAIKDFHDSNPCIAVNYKGFGEELFQNLNWIDKSITHQNADQVVKISMDLIHNSNKNGMHVVRCIEYDMMKNTGFSIKPGDLRLPIVFSKQELEDKRMFIENNIPQKYWIINAGGKDDFPTKHYPREYFQKIVDLTKDKISWVQVGLKQHDHKPLIGTIDMLDKTKNLRDFFKLIYFSSGVLSTITSTLHLSTMPMSEGQNVRPCVVLGGGREAQSFTLYPNHHWFSSVGSLDCCKYPCWRAKVEENVSNNGCSYPMKIGGQWVPKCMTIIDPQKVADKILQLI